MKYKANPVVVDAFKIIGILDNDGLVNDLPVRLENDEIVYCTDEMMSRMKPAIGDYWVVQSDGYTYLNPKEVFERKYSPCEVES